MAGKIANIDSILNGAKRMGWDNAYVEEQIFSSLDGNISPSEYETEIYDKCLNFRELSHDKMKDIVYLNNYSEYYGDNYEDNQLVSLSDVEFETSIINLDIPIRYNVDGNSFVAKNSFKFSFYKPGSDMSEEDPMVIVYSPNENLYSSTVTINKPVKINIPRYLQYEYVDGFKIDYVGQRKLCSCKVSFADGDTGTDDVEIADINHKTFYFYNGTYEDTIANTTGIYIEANANKDCGSNPDSEKIYERTINVDFTNSRDEVIAYYLEYSFDGNNFMNLDGQSPTIIGSQASETKSFTIISNEEENNYLRNNNFYVRISTMDTVRFGHCYGNFSKANASPIYVDETDDTTCTFRIPKWNIDKGEVNLEVEINEP